MVLKTTVLSSPQMMQLAKPGCISEEKRAQECIMLGTGMNKVLQHHYQRLFLAMLSKEASYRVFNYTHTHTHTVAARMDLSPNFYSFKRHCL